MRTMKTTQTRSKPRDLAEAKLRFAEALENISPAALIRSYPLQSAAAAAAMGVFAALSRRRLMRMILPMREAAYLYHGIKRLSRK